MVDKKTTLKLNLEYAVSQGLYWMGYCAVIGYTSVYLLAQGYSNTGVGMIMAVGFFLSVFIQQAVATFVDQSKRFNVLHVLAFCYGLLAVDMLAVMQCHGESIILSALYAMAIIILMVVQPLVNSVSFYLGRTGAAMNFGVGRSFGSIFFAILSTILGSLVESTGTGAVPVSAIVIALVYILLMVVTLISTKNYDMSCPVVEKEENSSSNIIGKYKVFLVFLVGYTFIHFGHGVINDFTYQLTVNVGGDSRDMGNLLAFAAVMEIPTMVMASPLKKKFGCKKLIYFSIAMYAVKMFTQMIAKTVAMFYVSMFFQMLSFAIFITAIVYLVDEIMDPEDAVKGQSFVTVSLTVANLLATTMGGKIIDELGVNTLLVISMVATVVGVIITYASLAKLKVTKA